MTWTTRTGRWAGAFALVAGLCAARGTAVRAQALSSAQGLAPAPFAQKVPMEAYFSQDVGRGCYYEASVSGAAYVTAEGATSSEWLYAPDVRVDAAVRCPSDNVTRPLSNPVRASELSAAAVRSAVERAATVRTSTPAGRCTYTPRFSLAQGVLEGYRLETACAAGPSASGASARGGGPSSGDAPAGWEY